jgi:hypothetical protein
LWRCSIFGHAGARAVSYLYWHAAAFFNTRQRLSVSVERLCVSFCVLLVPGKYLLFTVYVFRIWLRTDASTAVYVLILFPNKLIENARIPTSSLRGFKTCACVCPGACSCTCVCVHIALLIQHATRMHHIVTSFVAPVAPPNLSTLSHKRHDFRKKLLNIKCVF